MIVPKCQQCSATTKKGQRCKRNTCKLFPYCWTHLKSIENLQVKRSDIPNAGDGLFYVGKTPFPARKKIVEYSAVKISNNDDDDSGYSLQVGRDRYLDSINKQNYPGRWINSFKHTGKHPNVRFTGGSRIYKKGTGQNKRFTVPIITTKRIKPNEELLLNYGRTYTIVPQP